MEGAAHAAQADRCHHSRHRYQRRRRDGGRAGTCEGTFPGASHRPGAGPPDRRVRRGRAGTGRKTRVARRANQLVHRVVRCGRQRSGTDPPAHGAAEGVPRSAVHTHLHSARRYPATKPAVRADPAGPLSACGRRADHLHASRPARLRAAIAAQRMVSGQSSAEPHPCPARRSTRTRQTRSTTDPHAGCRTTCASTSNRLTSACMADRVSRSNRGRGARGHRAVATSPKASHRALAQERLAASRRSGQERAPT